MVIFVAVGYQLKAGHFPPFWLYENFTIKQNLRVTNCLNLQTVPPYLGSLTKLSFGSWDFLFFCFVFIMKANSAPYYVATCYFFNGRLQSF